MDQGFCSCWPRCQKCQCEPRQLQGDRVPQTVFSRYCQDRGASAPSGPIFTPVFWRCGKEAVLAVTLTLLVCAGMLEAGPCDPLPQVSSVQQLCGIMVVLKVGPQPGFQPPLCHSLPDRGWGEGGGVGAHPFIPEPQAPGPPCRNGGFAVVERLGGRRRLSVEALTFK